MNLNSGLLILAAEGLSSSCGAARCSHCELPNTQVLGKRLDVCPIPFLTLVQEDHACW